MSSAGSGHDGHTLEHHAVEALAEGEVEGELLRDEDRRQVLPGIDEEVGPGSWPAAESLGAFSSLELSSPCRFMEAPVLTCGQGQEPQDAMTIRRSDTPISPSLLRSAAHAP